MSQSLTRISDKERAYVLEVLDGQFRTSFGARMTKRLEETFAATFGVRYAIAHCNGTATLHSSLAAAGVGPGDEVIVPPLTMASTAMAVLHANARPVFADIDRDTLTIDPRDIERRITPATKAIIPVALYGLSPDMDPIMALARRYHLTVVEDDAQCFLGQYKGHTVGSIGHLASFSFQSSKHITSGEGGMVITDDEDLADKVRRFNTLGYAAVSASKAKITKDTIQDPSYERHVSIGWNYRMSELCAAVALAQTERLAEFVDQRCQVAQVYAEAIRSCDWLVPQTVPQGYTHTYWTYVLRLEESVDFSWYDFRRKYLEYGGDGIYAAWQLTYLEPAFRELSPLFRPGLCPIAESVQPRLLQFKTNYMDLDVAAPQAEALARTVAYFGG